MHRHPGQAEFVGGFTNAQPLFVEKAKDFLLNA
jgi:hypothetical protein